MVQAWARAFYKGLCGPRNKSKNKETEIKGCAAKEMAEWTQSAARRIALQV